MHRLLSLVPLERDGTRCMRGRVPYLRSNLQQRLQRREGLGF